jgi:rhodanese-related sulfurtransferase
VTSVFSTSSLFLNRSELAVLIGRAHTPCVLDVRRSERFAQSSHGVPTARHVPPDHLPVFIQQHRPQAAIVYCVHGHELSQGAVLQLREAGWDARYLAGGIEGGEPGVDDAAQVAAWRAEPLPLMKLRPDLDVGATTPSRWVTRERPKIDRVACPWLIRRFIDRDAQFLYAPAAEVLARAETEHAVAFDLPGAPISHEDEHCSFDALLRAFDLNLPGLDRLTRTVRGADTNRPDLAPAAAGLLAVSLGMSRLHAYDDHAMLDAMMPVYDALYAWCLDQAGGRTETHSWSPV